MADETTQEVAHDEPHGEDATDYKALYEKAVAESRKWEARSKANAEAARKLEQLEGGAASVEERIAALESDKKRLEDEKARGALVSRVAKATGVDASIVSTLSGEDEDALTAQAQAIAALKPKGAPEAPEAGQFPHGAAEKTNAQKFGDALNQMLGR